MRSKWNYANFRTWVSNDGRLVLLSVFLAIIAWFLVHSAQRVKEERIVPIEYINLPSSLSFAKQPPKQLKITALGVFHRLKALDSNQLAYKVDLSNAQPGRQSVDVQVDQIEVPVDIDLLNAQPASLDLYFESREKKNIPVVVHFTDEPPEGFVVGRVRVEPNPVQVMGPQSAINKLDEFSVNLSVHDRKENFSAFVSLDRGDLLVETIEGVSVHVEMAELSLERVFSSVPVLPEDSAIKARIIPPRAKVIVRGSEKAFSKPIPFRVVVPVEGLSPGSRFRIDGKVVLEDRMRLISLEPKSFIVEVLR